MPEQIADMHRDHDDGLDPQRLAAYQTMVADITADPVGAAEDLFRPRRQWMRNAKDYAGGADPILIEDRLPFLWRGHDASHPGQAEIVEAIFRDGCKSLAVATGQGIGKTFDVSIIAPLWLLTHYNGKVVLTGANWDAVTLELVPAMRQLMKASNLDLSPYPNGRGSLSWGDTWLMIACSPERPEGAQGKHAGGGVLVIVDEASHLEHPIFNALLSNCTGAADAIVLLGNPLRSDGPFADVLLGRASSKASTITRDDGTVVRVPARVWRTMHISGLDTPNVREGKELYPGVMSLEGLALLTARYEKGTAEYTARIEGNVPDADQFSYIARSTITKCGQRPTIPWEADKNLVLACDVARSPVGDRTVFGVKGDHSLHVLETYRGLDKYAIERKLALFRVRFTGNKTVKLARLVDALAAVEGAGLANSARAALKRAGIAVPSGKPDARVKEALKNVVGAMHLELNASGCSAIPAGAVHVDGTGMGTGLCDDLEAWGYPTSVRVIAAGDAHDVMGCANRRAEGWKNMKIGLETLAVPQALLQELYELPTVRYSFDGRERLLMERTEVYKKRNEKSPDVASMVALLYYREPGDSAFSAVSTSAHRVKREPSVREGFVTRPDGRRRHTWLRHLDGEPATADKPGSLYRAIWLPRRERSAAVWAHVASNGYWTILDAIVGAVRLPTAKFWARVIDKSLGHRYLDDVFSCPEGHERRGETHVADVLYRLANEGRKGRSGRSKHAVPRYIEPTHIDGSAGLDALDAMLLASLAWWPDHPYWKAHGLSPDEFHSPVRIGVWPENLLDALSRSRLNEDGWKDEQEEESPESLVAGGGPLVKCLQLMIVEAGA